MRAHRERALAFELARLGVNGPTLDGIHPTSMYGIVAFVAGRGAMLVLVLAPLVAGSLLGVGLTGRSGDPASAQPGGASSGC